MAYVHKPRTSQYRRLEREAFRRGASKFGVSTKANYKYFVVYNNRTIHFGDKRYEDYTFHGDPTRRANYKTRHGKIVLKDGTPAYKNKNKPAYWSWYLLW